MRREVLVIGSGCVGAACAAALAREGLRVTMLHDPRRSTAERSGGHLLLQTKPPGPALDLARRSLELTAAFARGKPVGFRQRGSLILAADAGEEAVLRAHFEIGVAGGLPLEWLSGTEARALEPALSPKLRGATFCPVDAEAHPVALRDAWRSEACALGAELTIGVVDRLLVDRGRAAGAEVAGEELRADAVVLAAGAWSGELAATAGLDLPVRPRRGMLLRGAASSPLASRPLLGAGYLRLKLDADAEGVAFSFQQDAGGECCLGGTREFASFRDDVSEETAARVIACGARYLPAVSTIAWDRRTVGFRPWTPAGVPYIGEAALPGLYLACGHEGDGIALAAGTAERIVALLTNP